MTRLSFDEKNIYVASQVPTSYPVKILAFIINLLLFGFTLSVVYYTKLFVSIALPILYLITLGKYFLWNVYGEEIYVISTTHISYQYNYGLFMTGLKTSKYDVLEHTDDITKPCISFTNLRFLKYSEVNNLPESVFSTAIKIDVEVFLNIITKLEEFKPAEISFYGFSSN